MSADDKEQTPRGEQAGRLPSLEEQTPGLDTEQEHQTEADAHAFFEREGGEGDGESPGATGGPTTPHTIPPHTMDEGEAGAVREGQPLAGDVRTAYSSEREPGAASPQGKNP